MKIIQAIIVIFAILGCLALALGGYFVYSMSTKGGADNLLSKIQAMRAENPAATEETTATAAVAVPANSEYAKIIQQYQPTPTPTPVAVAPVQGQQPGVAAPGQPGVVVANVPQAATAPAVNQRPITTPKPDEGKIRNWPSGRKWVALTYDDGPHPEWTPKMVELLRRKNVKATFFFLGQEIKRFPEIGKSVYDNGFEVGNHTMNHPDFNKSAMTPKAIMEQLKGTNDLIAEYIMKEPVRTMRPPYGNTPKKLVEVCAELGLNIVAWDIDTDDWRSQTDAKAMVNNIMKNLSDGSIILMHDKHQKTYDTTEQVIDLIHEKGYEFVTLSELLGLTPYVPGGAAQLAASRGGAVAAPAQVQQAAPAAPVQPAAAAQVPGGAAPAVAPAAQALPPAELGDTGAASLPVPSAATPVPAIDPSKITQPPPQR